MRNTSGERESLDNSLTLTYESWGEQTRLDTLIVPARKLLHVADEQNATPSVPGANALNVTR
jgi:hypothetical protein